MIPRMFNRLLSPWLKALLPALCMLPAAAQGIVVDGLDADDDGDTTFTTLQAAVNYAVAQNQTAIEVRTNEPLAGFEILGAVPDGLTVRAAQGYHPNATSSIRLLSTTPQHHITVDGIDSVYEGDHHFDVTGNVTVQNCRVEDVSRGSSFSAFYGQFGPGGVYGEPAPDSTVTLRNVHAIASIGIDTYTFDHLVIEGCTIETPSPSFACVATFARPELPFVAMTLKDSVFSTPVDIMADASIRFPGASVLSSSFSATNCIFIGGGDDYNKPNLRLATTGAVEFRHCNFKSLAGVTVATAIQLDKSGMNVNVTNCLFDMPIAAIGVFEFFPSEEPYDQVTGSHNLYNLASPQATHYLKAVGVIPPFEGENLIIEDGSAMMTDDTGHLLATSAAAMGAGLTLDPAVAVDIDGDTRPSPGGSQPDIGADEYVVNQVNAAGKAWTLLN